MADRSADYREFYRKAKEIHMPVSPETGKLLYMLARATRATSIVEFGTSFGISTIHLAAAVRDNGGGRLIGRRPRADQARSRARQPRGGRPRRPRRDPRRRRARDVRTRSAGIDRHRAARRPASCCTRRSSISSHRGFGAGAFVVADNADASPDYISRVRAPGGGFPVGSVRGRRLSSRSRSRSPISSVRE